MLPLGSPTPFTPDGDPQVEPHPHMLRHHTILIIFNSLPYIGLIGQAFVILFVPELPRDLLEEFMEEEFMEEEELQLPTNVHVVGVTQDRTFPPTSSTPTSTSPPPLR